MSDQSTRRRLFSKEDVTLQDVYDRQCTNEILATTALYGPWKANREFDWQSYENLVIKVIQSGSVPATNVDTTWAIYNAWPLTKELIWRTAEIAAEYQSHIAEDRPLVVAGLNTNLYDISPEEIVPTLLKQLQEIDTGLRERGLDRVRYMPLPDKRLYAAPSKTKIEVYQNIGKLIGDFSDLGMVFFELDIGIAGFGSNFSVQEIETILAETPQIQEYKSAVISRKSHAGYAYDFRSDLVRISIVESVCPERVQFSTGNDWFIALARYGKYLRRHGYLLGASQMSPELFRRWREHVFHGEAEALAIEQDLQAAAKDFWTPGNVGIYRHYLAIFLAMTGLISFPLPHPNCEARYRVPPENYFLPLKHALRLGLIEPTETKSIVRHYIPGCRDWTDEAIHKRIEWLD